MNHCLAWLRTMSKTSDLTEEKPPSVRQTNGMNSPFHCIGQTILLLFMYNSSGYVYLYNTSCLNDHSLVRQLNLSALSTHNKYVGISEH